MGKYYDGKNLFREVNIYRIEKRKENWSNSNGVILWQKKTYLGKLI